MITKLKEYFFLRRLYKSIKSGEGSTFPIRHLDYTYIYKFNGIYYLISSYKGVVGYKEEDVIKATLEVNEARKDLRLSHDNSYRWYETDIFDSLNAVHNNIPNQMFKVELSNHQSCKFDKLSPRVIKKQKREAEQKQRKKEQAIAEKNKRKEMAKIISKLP